jgi:hypothetical protein
LEPLLITERVKPDTIVNLAPSVLFLKTTLRKEEDVRGDNTAQKEAVQSPLVLKESTVIEMGFQNPLETVRQGTTALQEQQDRIQLCVQMGIIAQKDPILPLLVPLELTEMLKVELSFQTVMTVQMGISVKV